VNEVFPATVTEIDNLLQSSIFECPKEDSTADHMMTSLVISGDDTDDGDVTMSVPGTASAQQEHSSAFVHQQQNQPPPLKSAVDKVCSVKYWFISDVFMSVRLCTR
jgi:hypothetical protein